MFDFLTLVTTFGYIGLQIYFILKIYFELSGFSDKTIYMDLPETTIKLEYDLEYIIQETINIPLVIDYEKKTISKGVINSSNILIVKKREFTIKELAFAVEDLRKLQLIFNYYMNCSPEKFINTIEVTKAKELNLTDERLKEINLIGQTNKKYSLASILKAYKYLPTIKLVGGIIITLSLVVFAFQLLYCLHILKNIFLAPLLIFTIIVVVLDVYFLKLRGDSKVCHILHEFNSEYSKINVSKLIQCLYI